MNNLDALLNNSMKEQTHVKYITFAVTHLLFLDADSPEMGESEKLGMTAHSIKMLSNHETLLVFLDDFLKIDKEDSSNFDEKIVRVVDAARALTKNINLA